MNEEMEFPETFEEFAKEYGFKDDKEIYTNGSDLISIFRVKQWLEHYNKLRTIETDMAYECSEKCSDNCKVKDEMDREEAIIHIQTLRTVTKDISKYSGKAIDEAVEMAIKALKQEPCPNAISRSDMLDAIGHGASYTSEELQRIIKGLPPVNPLSKDYNTIYYTPKSKTGHWIEKDGFDGDTYYDCSECGESWTTIEGTPWDNEFKYCPNCGCRMVEPQESEEE